MEADENLPLRSEDPLAKLVRQDLDPMSVDELEERIATLKSEISRCEGKIAFATRHRSVADALFKK
jgi:uncharacterized small protein (DUF1192 family)